MVGIGLFALTGPTILFKHSNDKSDPAALASYRRLQPIVLPSRFAGKVVNVSLSSRSRASCSGLNLGDRRFVCSLAMHP